MLDRYEHLNADMLSAGYQDYQNNLAGVSGIQKDVIERIVEPFLKEMGLMAVTSKRIITDKGLDYIIRPEVTYG